MNKYLETGILAVVIGIAIIGGIYSEKNKGKVSDATSVEMGVLDRDPCWQFVCRAYHSDYGFSFKYPDHMYIMNGKIDENDNDRLIIRPKSHLTDINEPLTAIIISMGYNDENMTPVEWLQGPDSGYDPSENYYRIEIDGQEGVETEGGMWTVVNTPDNKWRISIADLADKDANILFTEMGIIINTLKFDKQLNSSLNSESH